MIDPNTIETVAALAGIAAIGGAVIFIATRPSRDWDAEGIAHHPDPPVGRIYQDRPLVSAEAVAEAHELFAKADAEATPARYWVPTHEQNGAGCFTVRDREHPMAYRRKGVTLYTTRSTALRAARRMNAKEEIARLAAASAVADLPAYDPKWARGLNPRFQIMGWPKPFDAETLVLDTDKGIVVSRHPNPKAAVAAATLLNNPVGGAA